MRPGPAAAAGLFLALALPANAPAAEDLALVYDGEFGGYVAVAGGIERPDLVVRQESGRVPEAIRLARRRARLAISREKRAVRAGKALPGWNPPPPRRALRSRWLRTRAAVSELLVIDEAGQPVPGARVFRFSDPAFYAVNDDDSGARLYGTLRFLPYPFPVEQAQALLAAQEEWWQDDDFQAIAALPPDLDQFHNPWIPAEPLTSRPPLEYLGVTNEAGAYRSVSGIFNLRDASRFPRAVVPGALRLGFLVAADGYLPGSSLRRLEKGGGRHQQTVILLRAPDHPVVRSPYWLSALLHLEAADPNLRSGTEVAAVAREALEILEPAFSLVRESLRPQARRIVEDRLQSVLFRRLTGPARLDLARQLAAADQAPPSRLVRLAHLLMHSENLPAEVDPAAFPVPPSENLQQAERLLAAALKREPLFQSAYPLLDRLLVRRGAPDEERRGWIERLMQRFPFDRWGRARRAALCLREGKDALAFDNLRYTWAATPGLGGDRELARQLADYYWRLGLPEKAGAYLWMLTGRVPEDPSRRLEGAGR